MRAMAMRYGQKLPPPSARRRQHGEAHLAWRARASPPSSGGLPFLPSELLPTWISHGGSRQKIARTSACALLCSSGVWEGKNAASGRWLVPGWKNGSVKTAWGCKDRVQRGATRTRSSHAGIRAKNHTTKHSMEEGSAWGKKAFEFRCVPTGGEAAPAETGRPARDRPRGASRDAALAVEASGAVAVGVS